MQNNCVIPLKNIECLAYNEFHDDACRLLAAEGAHPLIYFAAPETDAGVTYKLYLAVANDVNRNINLLVSRVRKTDDMHSLTASFAAMHPFERGIHELHGLRITDHPWLKPLRYPHNRHDQEKGIYDYPFYQIESEELHRVGVGPIHAGVIEPGHFRFICDGEKILHLEIQLGWQHRGVETLMTRPSNPLYKTCLAESVAGDSAVAHATAFVGAVEALAGWENPQWLDVDRAIALEQERLAIHTGDLGAICGDVGYQLGAAVFGRLRTPMINFMQKWCGNRLGKSVIRPFKTNFPFTEALANEWAHTYETYLPDFLEMAHKMFDSPSVLGRIERTGTVSGETAAQLGLVGPSARASNLERDTRAYLPWGAYGSLHYQPATRVSGDVNARAHIRFDEIKASADLIETLIEAKRQRTGWGSANVKADYLNPPQLVPNSLTISVVEGWRGEICHVAITDEDGHLKTYKIKDPSVHNWMGLAMAVRGQGISDFPICNKSFSLSYCGHDL